MESNITTVSQAVRQRHSVRAFLDKPVDETILHDILDAARFAPSGVNIQQPWQVAVVTGQQKQALQQQMVTAFENGTVLDN